MNVPQARPATALLARKGHAAPVAAASDTAQISTLADGPHAEALPEIGAADQAAAAPPASLLPLDFLAGRSAARNVAEVSPSVKPAPTGTEVPDLSAKSEGPRPDPALRLALGPAGRPALDRAPRRFPALAAGLVIALVLGATGYGYQSGWFVSKPPERSQAAASTLPAATPAAAPLDSPTFPLSDSTG